MGVIVPQTVECPYCGGPINVTLTASSTRGIAGTDKPALVVELSPKFEPHVCKEPA